jgi:CRISPR/Cas system CSM-associated protein Csm5 (group 7 of RAMP superfamily)
MKADQIKIIKALAECRFLPGSYVKGFVRDIYSITMTDPGKELTEKQIRYLAQIEHNYRRQLRNLGVRHYCYKCKDAGEKP